MSQFNREMDAIRAEVDEEYGLYKKHPLTSGVVVHHKASGTTMVVVGQGKNSSWRACAWLENNVRHEEEFRLCELSLAAA